MSNSIIVTDSSPFAGLSLRPTFTLRLYQSGRLTYFTLRLYQSGRLTYFHSTSVPEWTVDLLSLYVCTRVDGWPTFTPRLYQSGRLTYFTLRLYQSGRLTYFHSTFVPEWTVDLLSLYVCTRVDGWPTSPYVCTRVDGWPTFTLRLYQSGQLTYFHPTSVPEWTVDLLLLHVFAGVGHRPTYDALQLRWADLLLAPPPSPLSPPPHPTPTPLPGLHCRPVFRPATCQPPCYDP